MLYIGKDEESQKEQLQVIQELEEQQMEQLELIREMRESNNSEMVQLKDQMLLEVEQAKAESR